MSNFIMTVTGADDEVDPSALTELSKEFEFVEWGILFSSSQNGQARYPSKAWRSALYAETMTVEYPVNLSAHICGGFTDQFLYSQSYVTTEIDIFYRRAQFNRLNEDNIKPILKYALDSSMPIILPANKKTTSLLEEIEDKSRLSILFDSSGGNGVAPETWPDHMPGTFICGYAGGINESNVVDVVTRLGARYNEEPFWIDFETGARTSDNKFDINMVKRILEKVKPYYGKNRIQLVN